MTRTTTLLTLLLSSTAAAASTGALKRSPSHQPTNPDLFTNVLSAPDASLDDGAFLTDHLIDLRSPLANIRAATPEEVIVTNVVQGTTSILTCSTTTTISTTACPTTTNAAGKTAIDSARCSSTTAAYPTCQADYVCSTDPATGSPTCLEKQNGFGWAGYLIASLFGSVVVGAVVGISWCCVRDERRTRRWMAVQQGRERSLMGMKRVVQEEEEEDHEPLMQDQGAGYSQGGRRLQKQQPMMEPHPPLPSMSVTTH